jgi:DNA-binding MarR family transcriptional regulator
MSTELVEAMYRLRRLQEDIAEAADIYLRNEFGLPLSWYDRLRALSRKGPSRVNDLAGEIKVTVGGTSKLVKRMATAGYIERRPNPTDGRSSLVDLTPAGKQLLAAADEALERDLSTHLRASLSDDAIETLLTCLSSYEPMIRPAARSR